MTALRAAWVLLSSRPAMAAVIAGLALVLLGEYKNHRAYRSVSVRPMLTYTEPRAQDWKREPLSEKCPEVTVLRPPAKEVKRLEREFGLGLDGSAAVPVKVQGTVVDVAVAGNKPRILALKTIPALPYGGSGLVTLPAGGGEVELTVRPNLRPFLVFRPAYSVGVLAGLRDGLMAQRAYVNADFLRVGRVHLVSSAGVERYGSESSLFIMAGLEVRF